MNERISGIMAPQRYRQLLTRAAREFAANGFQRASLNAIIRDCAMSKSSFYHYFASKEALFDQVIAQASAALAQDLAAPEPAALAGPHFWTAINTFAASALAVSLRQEWYSDLGKLFYLPDLASAQSPALQQVLGRVAEWLKDVLTAGRACGAIRTDLPASLQATLVFAILQGMDRWTLQHMHEFDLATGSALAQAQLDALRRLLAPDGAATPTNGSIEGRD